jgi:hypothetical protein
MEIMQSRSSSPPPPSQEEQDAWRVLPYAPPRPSATQPYTSYLRAGEVKKPLSGFFDGVPGAPKKPNSYESKINLSHGQQNL